MASRKTLTTGSGAIEQRIRHITDVALRELRAPRITTAARITVKHFTTF